MTRCNVIEVQGEFTTAPSRCCGDSDAEMMADTVEEQIADFLDGRTHGEELLHAIYDRVLDEPIPERMRALFRR